MRGLRLKRIDVTTEYPLHLVVIEEAPELAADPEAMRIVDRLVRLAAKTGICVIWVSQMGDAVKAFGLAGTSMRQQLKAGNIWAFFLSGESIGQVLSGARDGDNAFDLSSVIVPKDVPGASVIWSPRHPVPSLGRAWWLQPEGDELVDLITGWADVPSDPMWQAILDAEAAVDAAEAAADADAGIDVPPDVRGNARLVLQTVLDHGTWRNPGAAFSTLEIQAATGLSPSSLNYALKNVLAKRGQIVDLQYGKWALAERKAA